MLIIVSLWALWSETAGAYAGISAAVLVWATVGSLLMFGEPELFGLVGAALGAVIGMVLRVYVWVDPRGNDSR